MLTDSANTFSTVGSAATLQPHETAAQDQNRASWTAVDQGY